MLMTLAAAGHDSFGRGECIQRQRGAHDLLFSGRRICPGLREFLVFLPFSSLLQL